MRPHRQITDRNHGQTCGGDKDRGGGIGEDAPRILDLTLLKRMRNVVLNGMRRLPGENRRFYLSNLSFNTKGIIQSLKIKYST